MLKHQQDGEVVRMMIDKQVILNALRDRGQDMRAAWVEKELPDEVDTNVHAGVLSILRLNPAELSRSPSSRAEGDEGS